MFPGGVSRFVVTPTGETSFDVYIATGDSKLVILSSGGERAEAGKIRGSRFIPSNSAEAGWSFKFWFLGLIGVDVKFDRDGKGVAPKAEGFGVDC